MAQPATSSHSGEEVKQIVNRKIALLLASGLVLIVMLFAMSPGFAQVEAKAEKGKAEKGGDGGPPEGFGGCRNLQVALKFPEQCNVIVIE